MDRMTDWQDTDLVEGQHIAHDVGEVVNNQYVLTGEVRTGVLTEVRVREDDADADGEGGMVWCGTHCYVVVKWDDTGKQERVEAEDREVETGWYWQDETCRFDFNVLETA